MTAHLKEDVNAPLWKMWKLLRPSLADIFSGEYEALGMFGICLCRAWELRINTRVIQALDKTLANRSGLEFRAGLARGAIVWVASAWLRIIYSYLQARLTWKWRTKLTNTLHREYFGGINYYLIGDGGGRGENKMSDADIRITNDANIVVDGFSKMFAELMFSTTAGIFYTVNILQVFGLRFALVPYAYLISAYVCVNVLAKSVLDNFRKAGRLRGESWGLYTFAAARLGLQAESIASLKGAAVEHKYLLDLWALHKHDIWEHNLNILKFGTVNSYFMHHFMEQMTGIVCIGRGILYPKFARVDSIEKMAIVRSDVGVAWVLYSSTMECARTGIEMFRNMQQLVSETERVTDLQELLATVKRTKAEELSAAVSSGDCICFENVDIVTPAGVLLVENLSFTLTNGQSMLLTGHNGAGKSSIFRCLGGLWQIPKGKIIRPGGDAQNLSLTEVFYIPQKPYNVWGTLAQQMTYPDVSGAEKLTPDKLRKLLVEVDLEYLVDHPGALDTEVNWDEVLSLGEKQRLAIARLLHHSPKFAILDECSSAISSEMERRLYKICKDNNITYITIAHRPSLRAYHDLMLAIGDGKQGFKLATIKADESLIADTLAMAKASIVSEEDRQQMKMHSTARSAPYSEIAETKPMPKERSTLMRLARLIKIAVPHRWWLKLAVIGGLIGGQTINEDYLMRNTGRMFGCLMTADRHGMLILARNAALGAFSQCVIWELLRYMQQELGTELAEKVWRNIMARYMKDNNFYRVPHIDARLQDAEMRICDDIYGVLLHAFHQLSVGVLRPFSKLGWFTYRISQLLGWKFAGGIWLYVFLSVGVLKSVMPDFRMLWRRLSKLDAKFKRVHVRVKAHSESIAFFGGGNREWQTVNKAFEDLMEHGMRRGTNVLHDQAFPSTNSSPQTLRAEWNRHWANCKFQCVDSVFRQRIPDVIQWILRFSYGVREGGSDDEMLSDGGSKVFFGQQLVMEMSMKIFAELGAVMQVAERFAVLAGRVQRVAEVQEVLDELEEYLPPDQRIGDRHPDLLFPLPKIDTAIRRAHVPGAADWRDAILQHERNENGLYLPLAVPDTGGEHLYGTHGCTADEEPSIILSGVDIVTPRGQAIATAVSCKITPQVSLEQPTSLMVTGQNASGKTSLARVVAGLWPRRQGFISVPTPTKSSKPGVKDVFFVPQRIHMCLGSLADQVTYPIKIEPADRSAEIEAKLQQLLDLVGVGYLVIRWGNDNVNDVVAELGWDHVCRWEDVLSLGEQQRLSLARMYFHKPKFAILDECTSAVSIDVEESLYRAAVDQGITCVTISQRLSLPEFHKIEMKMGSTAADGFTVRPVDLDAAREANLRDGRSVVTSLAEMYPDADRFK